MSNLPALCLLVILWTGSRPGTEAKLPQKIDLEQQSFAVSADVSITRSGKVSDHYTTEEFHSAWQLRSRVNYKIEGPLSNRLSERGTIYSAERQLFLVDRSNSATCKRVEVEVVDRALNVDFVKLQETRHHIGTTRLLLFIQQKSDKFQPIVMKTRTFEQDILSQSRYEAHLDGGLTISVLYEESSALSLALGVPSKVLVTKDKEFTMLLKFMRIVPLQENEFTFSGSSSSGLRHAHLTAGGTDEGSRGGSSDLLFDMLAVERAIGCSSDSVTKGDFLGQLADSVRYRFSFRARLESETLIGPYELVVGYEPELQTMRVDRSAKNRYSHTLASYRHDRVYHTYQRRGSGQFDYFFDSILKVTQHDELDNDVTCVVMKAGIGKRLMDECENPFSLGEMLLGATEVTYLGLARVRGIEAYAFEASGSRMPVWLENPSVYRFDASEAFELRRSDLKGAGNRPGSRTYTTVFYFARPESNRSTMIKDNRLLFMEIFKQARGGHLIASYTITVFDFTWQISAVAPNGQRTEDFYSLGDECPTAATENNHYARINLQLKGTSGLAKTDSQTKKSVANEWLRLQVVRNLAIMRAFYEQLSVPPTLAYDVESRYSTGGGDGETVDSMAVTMLAAERPEAPVDLIYLGNAYLKSEMQELPISLTAFNFETCYLLAAHSRKNTLLAWNELTSKCYMFHRAQGDSVPPEVVYDMNLRGPMEVYRVVPDAHRKLAHDDYVTKLDELHERLMSTGRLLLADPTGEVNGHHQDQDQEHKQAYFGIDKLEVLHLNERTAYDLAEGDKHLSDINKFPGLGLMASDTKLNKLIEPKPQIAPADATGGGQQVAPAEATMTFERCQRACLMDLECRSFSTCILEGKLQCVLSTVDFRASTLVLQLMFLQEEKSKLGAISSVRLESAEAGNTPEPGAIVHVRKHPTCELHNKLYTDLFKDGGSYNVNLQDRLLSPVTHPEQCAQKCYEITLESMREELIRLNAPKEKPGDWARFYAHTHCAGYFYLAHELVGRHQFEITPEQLDGKNVDGATRGYCLFERGQSQFQLARTPEGGGGAKKVNRLKSQVIELRQFNLDFGVFYEKTHGVSLVETAKSLEEAGAYVQVAYMRKFEPQYLDMLVAFMERGGNTGSTAVTQDPATCARLCFTQITPLWPACRSFEYVQVTDKTSARKNAFCAFNTATLREARTVTGHSLLVRDKSEDQERVRGFANDQIQVWHYEPSNALVAGSLTEAFKVSLGEASQLSLHAGHDAVELHLSSVGVFCLSCIVLVAGLVVGARLGCQSSFSLVEFLRRGRHLFGSSRGDRQTLVESATHIKIDDIVRPPDGPRKSGHLNRSDRI